MTDQSERTMRGINTIGYRLREWKKMSGGAADVDVDVVW